LTSPPELVMADWRAKVNGQLSDLESARTRAGVAIAASGVIVGLFAQHLTGHIGNWGLAALAAFVLGALPAIWILLPHKMTVTSKGNDWITWAGKWNAFVAGNVVQAHPSPMANDDRGGAQLALEMADSMRNWYSENVPTLNRVQRCVAIAFAAVLIQMVCWVGAVSTGPATSQAVSQTTHHSSTACRWGPCHSCRGSVGFLHTGCHHGPFGPPPKR
jgi:hypothetical protein